MSWLAVLVIVFRPLVYCIYARACVHALERLHISCLLVFTGLVESLTV